MKELIIVLAILVIAVLVYKLWKPMSKPKREVPPGEARLYFFYTDWCGFSQKAMPEWEKLEGELSKTSYFGKTHVSPVRVNAEEDRKTAMLYEIDAYPTIVLETKSGITEYTKRPTTEGLLQFLRESLGKETTGV